LSIIALAALTMLTGCQRNRVTIEGTITGAPDSLLLFEHLSLEGPKLLDSLRLDADGTFTFHADATPAPEFYRLRIADQIITLTADTAATITVKAEWPAMAADYEVEGSAECITIRELALKQQRLQQTLIALEGNYGLSQERVRDSIATLLAQYKDDIRQNYIYREPQRASSYFALFQTIGPWLIFDPQSNADDMKVYAAVATSWDTFHPNAERGKNLHNIALKSMRNQRIIEANNRQEIDESKVVETGVIDLNLPDTRGTHRTLTALKGKVVMLDFHIFSMQDSPQRILMLRELYNKYHDRGLEIYQVSVDADEHYWKTMCEQLPWVCVFCAEGVANDMVRLYNVQSLPTYFLIGRGSEMRARGENITDLRKAIEQEL
jgi:hypothetical protein